MTALAILADETSDLAQRQAANLSFQDLARSIDDPLLLLDDEGRIVHANPATHRVFGVDAAQFVGRPASEFLPSALRRRRLIGLMRRLRRASDGACRFEAVGQHADGRDLDLEACLAPVQGGDRPLFSCLIRDVTDAKAVERRLRASEERLTLALRGAHDAHWDWDLVTRATHLSSRWREMLGLDESTPCEGLDAWFSRVIPEDRGRLQADLTAHLDGRTRHFHCEHRVRHADGSVRWMLARGLALTNVCGRSVRIAGSLTDITARVKIQQRLRREATRDPLTGLPNRAFFSRRLRKSVARARKGHGCPAIVYIDLDGFKRVNDVLGHHAGDELLVAFADRLRALLHDGDLAARLGGDEFIVLCESGLEEAVRLARDLQSAMRAPILLPSGEEAFTSASIGIAELCDDHGRPEDLVRDADTALYDAKTAGKARHAIFMPGQRDPAHRRCLEESSSRRSGPSPGLRIAEDPQDALSARARHQTVTANGSPRLVAGG